MFTRLQMECHGNWDSRPCQPQVRCHGNLIVSHESVTSLTASMQAYRNGSFAPWLRIFNRLIFVGILARLGNAISHGSVHTCVCHVLFQVTLSGDVVAMCVDTISLKALVLKAKAITKSIRMQKVTTSAIQLHLSHSSFGSPC